MRIAILQFLASNCEQEIILAVEKAGMKASIIQKVQADLSDFDGYVILDHCRNDFLKEILLLAQQTGKPILGMGEGVKPLLEYGLIPGLQNYSACIQITESLLSSLLFTQMKLREDYQYNAFTRYLTTNEAIVTNAIDSRFMIPCALLKEMQEQGLDIFHLNNPDDVHSEQPAALSNKVGNVMAILPHHLPAIFLTKLFQSMHDYIEESDVPRVVPLFYQPRS